MKRETRIQLAGFGLVAACYLACVFFVFTRDSTEEKPGQITLRIAHWQLESGLRNAFDQLSAEYTRQHPHVRIEQMVIPERIFPNWLVAQLIGGTAPDLIQIGKGSDDDRIARFFVPLTPWVGLPNPANEGTPLEGVPWRDTFLDGMQGGYNPVLLDYYSAGLNLHTLRLYYNKSLYEKIMGAGTPLPSNLEELEEVFAHVEAHNKSHAEKVVPIAGSNYNGPIVLDQFMSSVTQRLQRRIDMLLDFYPTNPNTQSAFLLGKWNFLAPEMQSGLALTHKIGGNLTPGFQSLRREDAAFYFLQGRALMIASGSWDVQSLRSQATFPIEINPIPLPTPRNPLYGKYVLGPISETDETGAKFGLTRVSSHPREALEFLQFMTSQRGDQIFANASSWLPSVIGVKIPDSIIAFKPNLDGYTQGISFHNLGPDALLIITQNLYRLYGDIDPVGSFTRSIEPQLPEAVRRDLLLDIKTRQRNITRDDTTLAALLWKNRDNAASEQIKRKVAASTLNQNEMESTAYDLQSDVDSAPPGKP